jgi:hypothetical protein
MKVRPVTVATRDVHEPVGSPQPLDEVGMRHPGVVLARVRVTLRERGAWTRATVPVRGVNRTSHGAILVSKDMVAQVIISARRAL